MFSLVYKEFGVDAELLIDHAWGLEPCGMKEIKAYKPETKSISEGQVLACPYPYDKARIIIQEMADSLVLQLTDKGLVTDSLTLDVGYDRENCDGGKYHGPVHIDHYGRTVPKGAHGSTKLDNPTNLGSQLIQTAVSLFDQIADKTLTVRRITIAANRVVKDEGIFQVDLFTDTKKLEKEKQLQEVMLGIKKKFGRNAVLNKLITHANSVAEARKILSTKLRRLHMPPEKIEEYISKIDESCFQSFQPEIRYDILLDINRFLLEALKIGYEYAVYKFGDRYLDDPTAANIRARLNLAISGKMQSSCEKPPEASYAPEYLMSSLGKSSFIGAHYISITVRYFTDGYYEDISGKVESVDGVYKELKMSTGMKNDIGKELPTIIPFEDILEVVTK